MNNVLDIVRSLDFDSHLPSTQLSYLKCCRGIYDRTAKEQRQARPLPILRTNYHDIVIRSVVAQTR